MWATSSVVVSLLVLCEETMEFLGTLTKNITLGEEKRKRKGLCLARVESTLTSDCWDFYLYLYVYGSKGGKGPALKIGRGLLSRNRIVPCCSSLNWSSHMKAG